MANWIRDYIRNNPELSQLPVVKRSEKSVHLKQKNGKVKAIFTSSPIHYKDGNEWKELDSTLLYDKNLGEYYANGIPTRISKSGLVKRGNYSQHTTRVGLFRPYTKVFTEYLTFKEGVVEDDYVIATGDIWEHKIKLSDVRLEETLTLLEKPIIPDAKVNDWFVIETKIEGTTFKDGWLGEYKVGGVKFPLPTATDANGNSPECKRYAKTIDGIQYVYTGVPILWLDEASYPIVIDPDYTAESTDSYIESGWQASLATARATSTTYNAGGTNLLMVGYAEDGGEFNVYRAFVAFDTSALDNDVTVTEVEMSLTVYLQSGSHEDKVIAEYDWSEWAGELTNATKRETAWDGALASGSIITWGSSNVSTDTPTLGGVLTPEYVSKTGVTYYAILGSRDVANTAPGGAYYRTAFYSSSAATAAYRPILSVTYTEPAVTTPRIISDLRGTRKNAFNINPAATPGAPSTGTYIKGDLYLDANGTAWVCITAGSPGTWRELAIVTDFYEKSEFLDEGGGLVTNAGSPIKLGEAGTIEPAMLPAVSTVAKGAIDTLPNDPTQFFNGEGDWVSGREKLTADRTYYIRTDGDDSNTGLVNNAGGAFLTIQGAIDAVKRNIDLGGYNLIFQVGAGTYTSGATLPDLAGSTSYASAKLVGDITTPSNVVISVSSGTCVSISNQTTKWEVKGFKVANSGGNAIYCGLADLTMSAMEFGACSGSHIIATYRGRVLINGNYTISGGGSTHMNIQGQSQVYVAGRTVTITGTPAFTYFALAQYLSMIFAHSMTFSGGATGTRYIVQTNSVLYTGGGGANYFPGNAAGSAATGGQYV